MLTLEFTIPLPTLMYYPQLVSSTFSASNFTMILDAFMDMNTSYFYLISIYTLFINEKTISNKTFFLLVVLERRDTIIEMLHCLNRVDNVGFLKSSFISFYLLQRNNLTVKTILFKCLYGNKNDLVINNTPLCIYFISFLLFLMIFIYLGRDMN